MEKLKTIKEVLVGDLIEEAKSKIRKVTTSYPCWIDGERTVNRYCIGHRIESYTEKEAIAQYVKEKVLEIL